MKLYTKQGDSGNTGLINGVRVPKNDVRVACYGDVDETNAALGAVIAGCHDVEICDWLRRIQSELFVLGSELATPPGVTPPASVGEQDIERLEQWIDAASDAVAPLRQFVLPGGTSSAAGLHVARTISRRAERSVVSLTQQQPVSPLVLIYLNRLSDLLFALARLANARAGVPDVPWVAPSRPASA